MREPVQQKQRFAGSTILVPKPEVKEEEYDEEFAKGVKVEEYLHGRRLTTRSDDPEDCPGYNAAFKVSLNTTDTWRGKIDEVMTMSIHDAGMLLVDLTHDGEDGPNGAMKDEPVDNDANDMVKDEPVNMHGKQDVRR
jgi:hypothetical protein